MAAAHRPSGSAVVVADAIAAGVGVAVGEGGCLMVDFAPHDVTRIATTANAAGFTAIASHGDHESQNGLASVRHQDVRQGTLRRGVLRPGVLGMAGRAVLAVLLTIGFYVVAIGLIIVLLAVSYLGWMEMHPVNIPIALFCLA